MVIAVNAAFERVHSMVGPEARLGPHNSGTGHVLFEQQRQNLTAQEIASRARVFVQVNRHFLCEAACEHVSRPFLVSFPTHTEQASPIALV